MKMNDEEESTDLWILFILHYSCFILHPARSLRLLPSFQESHFRHPLTGQALIRDGQ